MATNFTGVTSSRAGVGGGTFPPEELANLRLGWNPRSEIDQLKLLELVESIAANPLGQREPIHVKKDREDGRPLILAGQRRWLAVQYINNNLIEYMERFEHIKGPFGLKYLVFDGLDERAAILHSISENVDREALTPIDQARTILSLRNMGWEDGDIADALRVKLFMITVLLSYLEMPKEAQDALATGDISQQLARELLKLTDAEIVAVTKNVKSGKVTSSEAVRGVKAKKRSEGKKVRRTPKEFFDELATLEAYNLAFDLLSYYYGDSTYPSLKAIIKLYNVDLPEGESARVKLTPPPARGKKK